MIVIADVYGVTVDDFIICDTVEVSCEQTVAWAVPPTPLPLPADE